MGENGTTPLQQLHRRLARKRKVDLMLEDLQTQLTELENDTVFLYEAYLAEEEELQRLEGESFSALLYRLMGTLEEKQAQGRAELFAAAMKYETAQRQLEDVQAHIAALLQEQATCADAENRFTAAFQAERQRLSEEDPQKAAELLAIEHRIAAAEAEMHEVEEAISVGQRVLSFIDTAAEELSSAEGWSTFDLLGGGLVADMVKHNKLEHAQNDIYDLQQLLRRYRTELADVNMDTEIRLEIGDFLRFADFFFDDIFSGITVLDRIVSAQQQLSTAENRVLDIQQRLSDSLEHFREEAENLRRQRETLVVGG